MAQDDGEYQPTEEDWEEYGRYLDEFEESEEEAEKRLNYLFGEEMAQKEGDKTVMDKFWAGAQKAAQSAFADIGNTYQAFLVRDSTFGALHSTAPEHDKPHSSPEIAKREAEKEYSEPEAPERAPDIEPER